MENLLGNFTSVADFIESDKILWDLASRLAFDLKRRG